MNEPTGIQDRPYIWWIHVVLNLVVAHVNSDTGLETRVIVGNGRTAKAVPKLGIPQAAGTIWKHANHEELRSSNGLKL